MAETSNARRLNVALWARVILAGPLTVVCSILAMGGMSTWLSPGAGQVNHLVVPVAVFPAIYATLLIYSCFDRNLVRAYLIVGGILAVNIAAIGIHFRSMGA